VPVLDGIQFRMHDESGMKNSEQESFWRDVFQQIRVASPNLRLDLRAKRLPDSVIESALEVGVPFRITTKYWMEQMGVIAMKVIGGGNGCLATGNPPQQVLRPYHDQTTHQVQPASLIRYTLSLPVSVAVIGVASVEQLKANIRMVREATPMTVAERRELETAMG